MSTNSTTTLRRSNPLAAFITGKAFIFVLRVLLGAVFVYSSAEKVADPARFAVAVRGYELLPLPLTNIFALALAWTEMFAGIMLILGVYPRKAAAAVFLMLVMFVAAVGITIVRGMVVDCGCFDNEGGTTTGYQLIVRNLFLIAAALMVMRFESGFAGLSGYLPRKGPAR